MKQTDAMIVFQDTKIRRIWFNEEWNYSVTDIIAVLTNSKDELAYWRKIKQRDPQLVTICHGFQGNRREERRIPFVAIARGIVRHLKKNVNGGIVVTS